MVICSPLLYTNKFIKQRNPVSAAMPRKRSARKKHNDGFDFF
jgi:hypothetical protein